MIKYTIILALICTNLTAQSPFDDFKDDNNKINIHQLEDNTEFKIVNEDRNSLISYGVLRENKLYFYDKNENLVLLYTLDDKEDKFLSRDPLESKFPHNSPYIFVSGDPINRIDPDGNADYYTRDGTHRGNDGKDDNKTMLSSDKPKDADKDWSYFKGAIDLNVEHNTFIKESSTIYGESSAYKMNNMTEDLKKEMFAIASVHLINKIAYGANSAKANEFISLTSAKRNESTFKKTAIAANINAHTGGFDYSYGAKGWDGAEQSLYDENEMRGSADGFELHMNTMGWSISDEHYEEWKKNVGDNFVAPQNRSAPNNYGNYKNKGKSRLTSTAVYLQTIFWDIK